MSFSEQGSPRATAGTIILIVDDVDCGKRLDLYLAQRVNALGRAGAARLCRDGKVTVDGRRVSKSHLLDHGARVVVQLGLQGAALPAPDIPLQVVLETPELVVVDKPAGVPCGALVGKEAGTLAGALLHRYPEIAGWGHSKREPGLIHRIDNNTSGLVLSARTKAAFDLLTRALSLGLLDKEYLALVAPGTLPDRGHAETHLAPDPRHRQRVRVSERGHLGRTDFEVRGRSRSADLVTVRVHTAYRHQIRCHLAWLGAPLLGDAVYGSPHPQLGIRHALHASYIGAAVEGIPRFAAKSELPEDLRALLV